MQIYTCTHVNTMFSADLSMEMIHTHPTTSLFLAERSLLSLPPSPKQTWHIRLQRPSSFSFEPGDSIGIYPQNDPSLVEHLIEAMGEKPDSPLSHPRTGHPLSLQTFLLVYANLARLTSSFLKLLLEEGTLSSERSSSLKELLNPENKALLKTYLTAHDPLCLLREYREKPLPLQTLCAQFGPLLPRFYSVASSPQKEPEAIDLTVARFSWEVSGEKRYGVASHFLCHLTTPLKTPIPAFVQPARHFRLPQDPSAPMIMIGPGTGIAPFRAFLQERALQKASGPHWLFFGECHRKTDFFYEHEWATYPNLRLETAFSRDQPEKIYVQHKMRAHAKTLYQWLRDGAYLYVCGNAKFMAKDVEECLQEIFMEQGKRTPQEAREELKLLRKAGFYMTDVY